LATLVQVLLWLVFTDDFSAILYRDARLTAAMVLGGSVLPPPATFDVGIMLAPLATRFKTVLALLAGVGFGATLYIVNLYGFTAIFPWFAQARGWITLIVHAVFGVTAISVYRWLDVSSARSQPDGH
jgi:hypothetical protein